MMREMKNETLIGEPDQFLIPEVGSYTEDKYDLVRLYCHLFASGMKAKWRAKRTYVDLYAGPGKCRVKGSGKILLGSPLIALSMSDPFDHYIFCEEDPERFESLRSRVAVYPNHDVRLVNGNCDARVAEICSLIPKGDLTLCFVDPFDIGFRFDTVRQLSQTSYSVDFLFMLACQMDAARGQNWRHYTSPENTKVDVMLGHSGWRDRWETELNSGKFDVSRFLAAEFSQSMKSLGYLSVPLHKMRRIRTIENNVPLYYLALFSKHQRAFDFWGKVLKYSTPQRNLFE
jgi:three-Cys-motif partner protein